MRIFPTTIPEVLLIEPNVFGDDRGFFMETYQLSRFREAGIDEQFVQDNHSGSVQGTLRGLHYQIQQSQGKLVRVVTGEVFDVAVDLRGSSPTFGKWVGNKLSYLESGLGINCLPRTNYKCGSLPVLPMVSM
jgi:dTDP-4-dehydrorhamnose 3,5-epimerase